MGTYQKSLFSDEEAPKKQVRSLGQKGVPCFQAKKKRGNRLR
jgi:hypothetical protein